MSIIVQKYGGSSVADPDKIRGVARRIVDTRAQGHQVVVVVSAMGKTTDSLLNLARQVAPEPGRRELDMLLSVGERISMSLLSMAINELGQKAISFTGSQSGIITDTSHVNARILEVRPVRILEALRQGKIVIVAGYQGVSLEKEVTTLGRGGSDTSAIALAAALNAEYCEICSDVDGVYSSDPREIPEASRISELHHNEMLELAVAGAKVLNAEAVAYARAQGIVIHAAATFSNTGFTRVSADVPLVARVVAVTLDRALCGLVLGPVAPGRVVHVLRFLAEKGVTVRHLKTRQEGSEVEISAWFRTLNVPDLNRILVDAEAQFGSGVRLEQRYGSVTVVGSGVCEKPELMAEVYHALGALGLDVVESLQTAWGLTLVMPLGALERAQQLLHAGLVIEKPVIEKSVIEKSVMEKPLAGQADG